MLVMTASVLGLPFALAKTASAFAVGILGGVAIAVAVLSLVPARLFVLYLLGGAISASSAGLLQTCSGLQ